MKIGDQVTLRQGHSRVLTVIRVGNDPNVAPYYTGPDGVLCEWEAPGAGGTPERKTRWFRAATLKAYDRQKEAEIERLKTKLDALETGA